MLRMQWFFPFFIIKKSRTFLLIPGILTVKFITVFLLFTSSQAIAGETLPLYNVDILVTDETTTTRQKAFRQGLDEVFIRISGDSFVMNKLKRPISSRYVKQFSYAPLEDSTTDKQGKKLNHRLKIQYNGSLMEKYLLENGFPVWGELRTDVVVWLVVRDGSNEYVLKDADQSLMKTAMNIAMVRRGVPERWPLYDSKDRKKLSVADIRGGFKDPLTSASKRYTRGPALAGSMNWNGKQWQSNWSLLMESGDQYWSLVDTDYERLINKAADQAADAMGIIYAIHVAEKNQQLVTIKLDIQAVNSIDRYRRVEHYLLGLTAVDRVKPLETDGQSAVFEVQLRSNEEDFLNLIKNDAELVEVKVIQSTPDILFKPADPDIQLKPADKELTEDPIPTAGPESTTEITAEENVSLPDNQQIQLPVYYYRLTQ